MLSILESRSLYASISYLKSQKAPVADWLHDCGLPPSLLDQVESRVPSVGWWKLLEFAASKLENDQLGVDIEAQDRGFSLMNQFGSAIYQNKTLASCWHEVAKLSQTQSSNAALSLSTTEKGLWLLGTGTEQRVENYPQIEQLVVCNFIRLGRFKLGEGWAPDAIKVINKQNQRLFSKLFPNADIILSSETGVFCCRKSGVPSKSELSNHSLSELSFSERLYQLLLAFAPHGLPSKRYFLDKLELSDRQLRSRLEQDKVTYRELVNKAKLEAAKQYLRDSQLKVIDIAHMLGYQNPNHFSRAFRKTEGETPLKFRQKKRPVNRPNF
ncbi:transcriptional regulator [Vibrio ishigakensis]|uniref:Transcriptional regulator n=1 Tax=Vibrio ishigakensis TaxID=1481914 RepID=A0A0B8QFP2_9VIBR|nr:transcriptional regulator [Vibrio ishigakensis]